MTILAFGCSIMHGAELVTGHQNLENTKYSYGQLVADHLNTTCVNYGVCGISNEGIFHNFFDNINKHNNIDMVIVGWTSFIREYWECDSRKWFLIPSWCSTMTNLYDPNLIIKDYVDQDVNNNPRVCADVKEYLDIISEQYKFLMRYKFDETQYANKTRNYIEAVRSYCNLNNIKLLETCAMWYSGEMLPINLDNIGSWRQRGNHPTKEEHMLIAKHLIEYYNL